MNTQEKRLERLSALLNSAGKPAMPGNGQVVPHMNGIIAGLAQPVFRLDLAYSHAFLW